MLYGCRMKVLTNLNLIQHGFNNVERPVQTPPTFS